MGFGIAALIIGVVGAGISTYAAYSQAQQAQDNAKTESKYREQEAESIRQSSAYEERQYRRRVAILLGKQNAIAAATGTDPTQGSPLLMELDNVKQGELEALNIRRTGQMGASAREYEARLARQRASYASDQKGYAIAGGVLQASRSVLSTWSSSDYNNGANTTRRLGRQSFQYGTSRGD